MNVIRFKRFGRDHGEIAFDEAHLQQKLAGEAPEWVVYPPAPWPMRLWRWLFGPIQNKTP